MHSNAPGALLIVGKHINADTSSDAALDLL